VGENVCWGIVKEMNMYSWCARPRAMEFLVALM